MKQIILASSIVATGLMAFSSVSHAAIYDFQQWVADNGEKGFNNSAPFTLTDSGLTLTATAFENTAVPPGMTASHVYMDGLFNGTIGGMGVCSTLGGGTNGDQCTPSSDDNVSIDGSSTEVLTWNFSQGVTSVTLELGDDGHFAFNNRSIEYSLDDGTNWLTASTGVADNMLTILLSGGTGIDFRTAGANITDQFYIRNADIAVVPVPAAVWLFGSGLLGLAGFMRRRK